MFRLSSSSSDEDNIRRRRTRTITLAYAEEPNISSSNGTVISSENGDFSQSSESSTSIATPSSLSSAQTLLDQVEKQKEKGRFYGYYPIWRDMSMSDGIKLTTLEYLWDVNIFQLFNFMMTLLLAQSPDDPVSFLVDLMDRCIRYRDGDGEPPLVFEDAHIKSVYVALDPLQEGSISYSQYLVGMQTLGLTEFNVLPKGCENDKVISKDVFIHEAKHYLIKQLNFILGKGRSSTLSGVVETVADHESPEMATKKKKHYSMRTKRVTLKED